MADTLVVARLLRSADWPSPEILAGTGAITELSDPGARIRAFPAEDAPVLRFVVEKSIEIQAAPEHVWRVVRDFCQWPAWSPWLIAEPASEVSYAEDGRSYRWDGRIVGAGEMAIEEEGEHRAIDCRLTFLKPWKSQNTTGLRFAPKDSGTVVTWTMVGSLPWFLFWMKPTMTGWIGMDYMRGLQMLKDLAETGAVPSKLEFPGVREHVGGPYVGINRACAVAEIGPSMEADFGRLQGFLTDRQLSPAGPPFAIYDRWDVVKGRAEYTAAVPLAASPGDLPEGIFAGELPRCQVYAVRHTGAYRHLANAWSAGMMHAQAKQFAKSKQLAPFEVYEAMPADESQAVTVVNFPTR